MPLTACTIQEVLSTDNPNQGRVKINNNFECLENTISELQVAANTGTTIVSASTNIDVILSYSGSAPVYSVGVVSNPTFSSLSSTTISTDGLTLNTIGSGTSIVNLGIDSLGNVVSSTTASISSYWTSGSTGNYSIRAVNDSGVDATGDYAIAEGYGTLAVGGTSHAEGENTIASGTSSHAEGGSTTALGGVSHAEGDITTAVGVGSHSEGGNTIAFGAYSHSEGFYSTSLGGTSHSEGEYTTASGYSSHAEGNSTTSDGEASHAEGSSTKAIGDNSHSEGYVTIASGASSHAEGYQTTAIGARSHAEGGNTKAVGDYAHSEGLSTTSIGARSHAEGASTIASGASSHAEGQNTTAVGIYSHAEGFASISSGLTSHAEGTNTSAIGDYSHAEGEYTIAIGQSSHAEGNFTTAIGSFSHSEGSGNISIGDYSHTEGTFTTAAGYSSHAEGDTTQAIGDQSHAGGYNSIALGETSFIHSKNSLVSGFRSVVLGGQNITGTTNDTVYVPTLNMRTIGSGTPISSLAIDSDGFIVSGSSENSNEVNLGPVLENTVTTPPSSPEDQDRYIVPSGSTDEWSGQTNTIAEWSDAELAWGYYTATTGDRTIVTTGINAGKVYEYSASSWVQISLSAPSSTPFYIGGTTTDAGSNKTSAIYRPGNLLVGGSTGTSTAYKFRVVGHALLDGIATRTAISSTNNTTRTNNWFKVFRYRFLSDTYSSETFKLMMTDSGNSNGSGQQVEFNVTIKKQVSSVYCSVIIDQKSKIYGDISDNFEVLYNNTTKELGFYYKPTQNYAASSWTVLSNRNYSLTGRFVWDNLYLSTSTLSGETSDSATIEKSVSTFSTISSTGLTTTHYGTLALNSTPSSGSTIDDVLVRASDGSIKMISQSGLASTNLGRVLFVSTEGDDSTAQVGNINKPWRNIYSAKSASTSGDTVYILPGTWEYDNRSSAGNPFNGQIETKVNLWKNGITYYFMPGSKIVFYNQTVSGQIMYLFNPAGVSGETCTVLGSLEWEGNSTGPDTSNGHSTFFWADSSNDSGFTFHAEFKKLTSYACEPIRVSRGVTLTGSNQANITLIGDEIYRQYLGGQTGAAAVEFYNGSNSILNVISDIKKRSNIGSFWYFQIGDNLTRSSVNIFGDYLQSTSTTRTFWMRSLSGTINIDIKKIYHGSGHVFDTFGSGGWTLNLKGDIIDNIQNGSSLNGVFWITSGGNTINFDGNISTNIGSGAGRFIAGGTSNNTYNIKGDVTYLGTGTTTNVMFYPQNSGVVNYTGKITGTYAGGIAQTLNGTVNINNSYIKSSVESSSARLFFNGTTSQGYFRLNNSYVELKNDTNALSNGSYIDAYINNSTIINSGSANTLSNTTNFGKLQVLNSTLISSYSGATSILNTGTTPVIVYNTIVNTSYNISDIRGGLTILTDLIY